MVTLEKDALQTAGPYLPGWADFTGDAGAAADSALLATLGSRLHCRTPMKRLDSGDPATGGQAHPEDQRSTVRPDRTPGVPGMATYRCRCGFMMDAPATEPDRAAAN